MNSSPIVQGDIYIVTIGNELNYNKLLLFNANREAVVLLQLTPKKISIYLS